MEFTINQTVFSKNLSEISRMISSRTILPILSGIKITATSEGLILTGTNNDMVIEKVIPQSDEGLSIERTGSIVVSAKYFTELIKRLPESITVSTTNVQTIHVTAENIETKFNGFQPTEYPLLPVLKEGSKTFLQGKELVDLLTDTMIAASKNDTRPVLTGVHLTLSPSKLTAVATDSVRLALKEAHVHTEVETSLVIPTSTIIELVKHIGHYEGSVELQVSEGYILFKIDNLSIYSRLIAGNYPNVASLISSEYKTVITLCKGALLNGIDRASLFAAEWKNNNIRLSIENGNLLRISSSSTEYGEISESQTIKELNGEQELTITVDGNFMKDALKNIQDSDIKLKFCGTMKPIVIEPVKSDSTFLHLISPVRAYH